MTSLLISLAISLCAGLMMTRFFKLLGLNFPDVTAYLITGLLIGPYGLGKLGIPGLGFPTMAELKNLDIISTVALGFIAFSIGNEFKLSHLKGIGKQATTIGILQAIVASVLVDIVLVCASLILGASVIPMSAAITLGAIASATAPAATLMVVRQYKAKGKVTDILLPVVALDDAVGLVVFAVSFGIAQALISSSISIVAVVINPIIEIILSLSFGALMGIILSELEKLFYSNTNRLILSISFVFASIAISQITFKIGAATISFSSLLVCMMLGTILCNVCERSADIMTRSEQWTAPLNVLFFVLSGAELELSVFKNPLIIFIGILYIISRSIGKYFGARESARMSHADENVRKYLGFALLPQAGVALGMSAQATALGGYTGTLIRNITLFSVLIYELAGPSITRWALEKSGDIQDAPSSKKSLERHSQPKI